MSSERETLWQRVRDMESQQNYAEAFKAALYLQRMCPKDGEVVDTLRRLNIKMQKITEENNSTENRVKNMLKYLQDETLDLEKRTQAANNILTLVRDKAGRELFIRENGFKVLVAMLTSSKVKFDIRLALIRVLTQLASGSEQLSLLVLEHIPIDSLINIVSDQKNADFLTSAQILLQIIVTELSGFDPKQSNQKQNAIQAQYKKYETQVDSIMGGIVDRINARTMTGVCRDTLLEFLMVNVDYMALNYGMKLLDRDGLAKLLEVASELEEVRYESSMEITSTTRTHVALVLEKVFNCMDCDKSREKFYDRTMTFLRSLLKGEDLETKVRATAAITALLNGPMDAGNYCLGQQGIIEMMLAMANSGEFVQQCIAAEAIIAAASKKDKGKSMANMGAGILKTLYMSDNPKIKVRALVGLCKLSSVTGTDASDKVFSEQSTMKLLKACSHLLVNATTNPSSCGGVDVKKWAADGLAYLSLDAIVKETLIADEKTLNALIELGKTGDLSVLFGVVTTFVNLTNSYDKQDIMPELVELAKFSKQHVPEEHEYDDKDYVDARCKVLAKHHVVSALVSLSKSQAKTSREMICRVFNAICEHKELQGLVIQEGGARVLIKLALENNTQLGSRLAGQALARLAIHNNPEIAFPGQRCVEVVKPLMELLHADCTGLQNFEALMALTNLGQVNPSVRNQILKEGGFSKIEHHAYEEHDMIKRAAIQCMVNLILSDQVVKMYEGDNDRVKYLLLLMNEDDLDLVKAASGALAMLTSVSVKAVEKIFAYKEWMTTLLQLVSSKDGELQHRGVAIVYNMINSGKAENAEKVVETPLFEVLMAIVRPEVDDIADKVKQIAREALKVAEEQKLIKNVENLDVSS